MLLFRLTLSLHLENLLRWCARNLGKVRYKGAEEVSTQNSLYTINWSYETPASSTWGTVQECDNPCVRSLGGSGGRTWRTCILETPPDINLSRTIVTGVYVIFPSVSLFVFVSLSLSPFSGELGSRIVKRFIFIFRPWNLGQGRKIKMLLFSLTLSLRLEKRCCCQVVFSDD